MAPVATLPVPSTARAPALQLRYGRAAEEIQGDILAGFLKDHETFLLLQFGDGADAHGWLQQLIPGVSKTSDVADFNERYSAARRRLGRDPTDMSALWMNVSFTGTGLLRLSPNLDSLTGIHKFAALRDGAAKRAAALGDVGPDAPDNWKFGGPGNPRIDAILTIAADDPRALRTEVGKQRRRAEARGITVASEQRGRNFIRPRRGVEHFGFRDSISQPGVRDFHQEDPVRRGERIDHPGAQLIAPGEFVRGYVREDGRIWAWPSWMVNGSSQVLRRLSQDVDEWRRQMGTTRAGLSPDLLAAKLVGRWNSGAALALAPNADDPAARTNATVNAFTFVGDDDGQRTPRCAHIRKMNPRVAQTSRGIRPSERRLLRRGIPFHRVKGVNDDRGLLFNAYMASIEIQFEFLLRVWANDPGFPRDGDGPDPVIGKHPSPVSIPLGRGPARSIRLPSFVQTTGALYAFVPSISTLRGLAAGQVDVSDARR